MNKIDCKNEIYTLLVKLSDKKHCMLQYKEEGDKLCG
jgi:hypothetical protein